MLTYHSGALVGSAAYADTSATGRAIVVSVRTSTAMIRRCGPRAAPADSHHVEGLVHLDAAAVGEHGAALRQRRRRVEVVGVDDRVSRESPLAPLAHRPVAGDGRARADGVAGVDDCGPELL